MTRTARAAWLVIALAGAPLLVAGAAAPHASNAPRDLPRTAARAVVPTRAVAATSTTTTSTTTTAPPPPAPAPPPDDFTLLTPEDVPDPSVRRPIRLIGRIQIPAIGLDAELRDQITQQSIDLGPSHWPGTAGPGGYGNAVIAGHRNSYSAPFHDLGDLHGGDAIVLIDPEGRSFTYEITEMFVVNADAMWITEQSPGRSITLFTCHPIGSAAQRLVIRGVLV